MTDELDILAALNNDGFSAEESDKISKEKIQELAEFISDEVQASINEDKTVTELRVIADETAEVTPEQIEYLAKRRDHRRQHEGPIGSINTKEGLTRKVGNILAQFGMMESNVPITHEYWRLVNHLRTMK